MTEIRAGTNIGAIGGLMISASGIKTNACVIQILRI